MTDHICATCGIWFETGPLPPACCPICEDDRQYVPRDGQKWLSPGDLKARYANRIEDDDGVFGIGMSPAFAINQRCALVEAVAGTVMWETTSLVTDEAVAAILSRGPVTAIAISHPHFYAAMHLWAEALDCPIILPYADRQWIQRPSARIELWDGLSRELLPGVTLLRCGGHFDGSCVLHWQDANCPEGALFAGDTIQVSADRKRVSAMHSYPNAIPLGVHAVGQIAQRLAAWRFQKVYGYTWTRNILADGDECVDRSLEEYVAAISA